MDLAIPKTVDNEASEIGIAAPRHIQGISDWLITQGLEGAGFESILSGFADRLNALGLQVQRGMIVMRTLHPSVDAVDYVWLPGGSVELINHTPAQLTQDIWLQSPLKFMFDNGLDVLRRRLTGPDAVLDFPLLEQLAAEGASDYYIRIVDFDLTGSKDMETGMVSSWASGPVNLRLTTAVPVSNMYLIGLFSQSSSWRRSMVKLIDSTPSPRRQT